MQNAEQEAVDKLESYRDDAKAEYFEPVIDFLIKRCQESDSLAQDVMQEHKTWSKCLDYIAGQAIAILKGKGHASSSIVCGHVDDPVVYEWAEDYFHLDDKAEEERKKKEKEEREEKRKEEAKKHEAERKAKEEAEKIKKAETKAKRKEVKGQMDLFSML